VDGDHTGDELESVPATKRLKLVPDDIGTRDGRVEPGVPQSGR